ncbi:hypothetical protein EP01_06720 [Bdellovibrio bacteriovorus]|nr:hypothetical protein EP01_06720 [Bdellovibrio bacteriovorus]
MKKKNRKTDEELLNEKFPFEKATKKPGMDPKQTKIAHPVRWDADVHIFITELAEAEHTTFSAKANALIRTLMGDSDSVKARLERLETAVFNKTS